jgi:glutamate dehydrogenase
MLREAGPLKSADDAQRFAAGWLAPRQDQVAAISRTIADIDAAGEPWTFAKLTIVNAALRELAQPH